MKRIWDTQNNEYVYAINKEALLRRIIAQKKRASHIVGSSEMLLVMANIIAGSLIIIATVLSNNENLFATLLCALMFLTAGFIMVGRYRRLKWQNQFELSIDGYLRHAISNATYQVWLSQIIHWFTLPVAIFTLLSMWSSEAETWKMISVVGFFILVFFASRKELDLYLSRKNKLEVMRSKLVAEE